MLSLKDRDGYVYCSLTGLARAANLGLEDTKKALERLESPDPESSSPEHEGRRIRTVQGGWLVLNATKHTERIREEYRKEYQRRKQKEYRDGKKVNNVPTASERHYDQGVQEGVIDPHTHVQAQSQ